MGDTIENPATGERITFLERSPELLVMDDVWTRPGHRAPEHVHPEMEERWEVLAGSACFSIGGEQVEAGPGDRVVAPAGTPHLAWNPTGGEVRLRIEMRPALRWEEFVRRLFTTEDPEQLGALMREFSREVRLSPPAAG